MYLISDIGKVFHDFDTGICGFDGACKLYASGELAERIGKMSKGFIWIRIRIGG